MPDPDPDPDDDRVEHCRRLAEERFGPSEDDNLAPDILDMILDEELEARKLDTFHLSGVTRGSGRSVHMIVDAATGDDARKVAKAMSGYEYCFSTCERLAYRVAERAKCRHLTGEEFLAVVADGG